VVARTGAALLVGAHGAGRTTLLEAVAASTGGPVGVGLHLLADEPQGIIRHALRTGEPLDPDAVAAALEGRPRCWTTSSGPTPPPWISSIR
jgi:predicted ATPase